MASRLQLHEILCDVLGSRNVYFQPPPNHKMNYPAIVYSRRIYNVHADNTKYLFRNEYEITYITDDPDDSKIFDLLALPYCKFTQQYSSDNLNHIRFNLYY